MAENKKPDGVEVQETPTPKENKKNAKYKKVDPKEFELNKIATLSTKTGADAQFAQLRVHKNVGEVLK